MDTEIAVTSSNKITCDMCCVDNQITHACKECQQQMCSTCFQVHEKVAGAKTHHVTSLGNEGNYATAEHAKAHVQALVWRLEKKVKIVEVTIEDVSRFEHDLILQAQVMTEEAREAASRVCAMAKLAEESFVSKLNELSGNVQTDLRQRQEVAHTMLEKLGQTLSRARDALEREWDAEPTHLNSKIVSELETLNRTSMPQGTGDSVCVHRRTDFTDKDVSDLVTRYVGIVVPGDSCDQNEGEPVTHEADDGCNRNSEGDTWATAGEIKVEQILASLPTVDSKDKDIIQWRENVLCVCICNHDNIVITSHVQTECGEFEGWEEAVTTSLNRDGRETNGISTPFDNSHRLYSLSYASPQLFLSDGESLWYGSYLPGLIKAQVTHTNFVLAHSTPKSLVYSCCRKSEEICQIHQIQIGLQEEVVMKPIFQILQRRRVHAFDVSADATHFALLHSHIGDVTQISVYCHMKSLSSFTYCSEGSIKDLCFAETGGKQVLVVADSFNGGVVNILDYQNEWKLINSFKITSPECLATDANGRVWVSSKQKLVFFSL